MKLSNSKRINAIKSISERLSTDDWTTIDLTLKTFGLPISDQWSGDSFSYVMDKLSSASDDQLGELADHFGIEGYSDAELPAPSDPPFWEEGKLRVFISHLTSQREQASDIKKHLGYLGLSGFVAHNDIEPTSEWQIEIENALATSDLLVAIFHPGFVDSKWCDQEIGYALGRGIPVFTVKCGQDPHGFVGRFQSFNGNGKAGYQIAREIFEAALAHKKLQGKMSFIVVNLFVTSGSFATAKERIEYLEKLSVWHPSFPELLERALKENGQVSGSWGVPERVKELLAKWA